ncbi:MAG: DOMON domain-containing protein [Pseudomonadota bacterium]
MNRRTFAAGLGLTCLSLTATAKSAQREIELDGTQFAFWQGQGRLHARFTAPTDGWLAAGFNNDQRLEQTRFVIGAMRAGGFYAEEHIAVGPGHPTVQSLGFAPAVTDVVGEIWSNRSTMAFSLPHVFPDTPNPRLTPGTTTYLMLAWSQDTDFQHHSAWRRHLTITV